MSIATRPILASRVDRDTSRSAGILHLCNGLDPIRDGGMVPSILGMTAALSRRGEDVAIVTPTPSRRDLLTVSDGIRLQGPETDLEDSVRRAGIVHMHGLWQGHTRRGAAEARRRRVPYVMAAHGMAEPWALRQKAIKKRIYSALVEGKNLRRAACLHALTRPEVSHLRALAPRTPVCLVPNGVDVAPFADLPARADLEKVHPQLAGRFVLLFFSRLHVKKGLDLLATAFAALAGDYPELHLLVAGNDDGAKEDFINRLQSRRLLDRVTFLGHVAGKQAREVWAAADAFVLPSYSEGFSMAVLEALACGLPALITTACHFPELAAADGGVVVRPDATGVESGLRRILEMDPSGRRALGLRGRQLVEAGYTWEKQAERLADVYAWLVGGGAPPEAVVA